MAPSEAQRILDQMPEEARKKLFIDNDGNINSYNRRARRKKTPTDNWYTKKTHSIQKKRKKNGKHNRRSAQT